MILAVIPARCYSKGLEYKNIRQCGGRSLVGRAIDTAITCGFHPLVTTDCYEMADYAERNHAETKLTTDDYLHSDNCQAIDVWLDAWDKSKYFTSVYLEPSSPLRAKEDIERCLALLDRHTSALTVSPALPAEKLLYLSGKTIQNEPVSHRQDAPQAYRANGCCYAMRADHDGSIFQGAAAVVIDDLRISIDTATDLALCELFFKLGQLD